MSRGKPLWTCPACGRRFVNRNQWHSCGHFTVGAHLEDKDPSVVALYDRFVEMVKRCGPVTLVPTKTRIGFQVRITFAEVVPLKRWLDADFLLARRLEHPRLRRIESLSPRNHVHHLRITELEELDGEVQRWLCEAYQVGRQAHLADR
ncbi:MAG: DUF5655 domain-containing protein [Acidimicrobiia bacterium]